MMGVVSKRFKGLLSTVQNDIVCKTGFLEIWTWLKEQTMSYTDVVEKFRAQFKTSVSLPKKYISVCIW
jgi:hypothetical protein